MNRTTFRAGIASTLALVAFGAGSFISNLSQQSVALQKAPASYKAPVVAIQQPALSQSPVALQQPNSYKGPVALQKMPDLKRDAVALQKPNSQEAAIS